MSTTLSKLPWENKKNANKVLVVGDLILDEYIDGAVQRISPEAPVPVHLVQKSSATAGGAGNVARNIKLVGGEVELIGLCGVDEAGLHLKRILNDDGIDVTKIIEDRDRPTTKKTRIRSAQQQLIRVDWEKVTPASQEIQQTLLNYIKKTDANCILISDYGKGCMPDEFIRTVIQIAKEKGIATIIDPKGTDFSKYAGCDYITPNRKEACEPLGIDATSDIDPSAVATNLQAEFNLKNILITLGADGMFFQSGDGCKNYSLPAIAREVFDVSGAGDTVAAIFALSIAANLDIVDAMTMATTAAGVVVSKLGTKPIYRDELIAELAEGGSHLQTRDCRAKVQNLDIVAAKAQRWREADQRVVFTNGCFDILHAGHVSYLEKARKLGDRLIIGLNTDASIKRIKGEKRPIVPEQHRSHLLAALSFVDSIVLFDEDTPINLIQKIKPDILVKGNDYQKSEIVGADIVESYGGEVQTVELVDGLSTSKVIEAIIEAYK